MRISERVYYSYKSGKRCFYIGSKRGPGRPQGDGYRCRDEARDRNRYFRGGGAAVFYQSALHRSLELAAKRRRSDRAEFFAKRISLYGSPQVDWAGNAPGYVGTEFPILPFVAAVCYKITGVHEWIGRIQAVILFAVSLPFFFLLVREIFGSAAAVWATFFYCFAPLNIFAGRSFMPDVQ